MPNINEQLAVLTALQKIVKERLDEVRAEADADLLAAFDEDGVTKKALKLGGIKVGDYIVMLTKDEWEVEDSDAFHDFALTYGFAHLVKSIRPGCMHEALGIIETLEPDMIEQSVKVDADWAKYLTNTAGRATFLDTGEPVPGVTFVGQRIKGTQVRGCKPEAVAPIIQTLGGLDRLLLGQPAAADAAGDTVADSEITEQ